MHHTCSSKGAASQTSEARMPKCTECPCAAPKSSSVHIALAPLVFLYILGEVKFLLGYGRLGYVNENFLQYTSNLQNNI